MGKNKLCKERLGASQTQGGYPMKVEVNRPASAQQRGDVVTQSDGGGQIAQQYAVRAAKTVIVR